MTAPHPRERVGPAVASPCISVCVMDPASGLCRGCLRTLDEIASWAAIDDGARRAIVASLPERRKACALAAAAAEAPGERDRR